MADFAQKVPEQQRLRGPGIQAFMRVAKNVSISEVLDRVDAENRAMASLKRMGRALNKDFESEKFKETFSCLPGTMAGYEKPGKRPGGSIVYTGPKTKQRYIFPTGDALGAKDVALAAEHPNYRLVPDGKDMIVDAESVGTVENFPASKGWYHIDPVYALPNGSKLDSETHEARYVAKDRGTEGVGPLAIAFCITLFHNFGWSIYFKPPRPSDVPVEAPEAPVQKKA